MRVRRIAALLCLASVAVAALLIAYIAHVHLGLGIYPRAYAFGRLPKKNGGGGGGAETPGYVSPRTRGPKAWDTFTPLPLTGRCL